MDKDDPSLNWKNFTSVQGLKPPIAPQPEGAIRFEILNSVRKRKTAANQGPSFDTYLSSLKKQAGGSLYEGHTGEGDFTTLLTVVLERGDYVEKLEELRLTLQISAEKARQGSAQQIFLENRARCIDSVLQGLREEEESIDEHQGNTAELLLPEKKRLRPLLLDALRNTDNSLRTLYDTRVPKETRPDKLIGPFAASPAIKKLITLAREAKQRMDECGEDSPMHYLHTIHQLVFFGVALRGILPDACPDKPEFFVEDTPSFYISKRWEIRVVLD